MQYTIPLASPQATLELTGGKGASLARLLAAGLPVPDGFHVTTAAYQKFIEENNLRPAILAALEGVDVHQPDTLEQASQKINDLFAQGQIPAEIAEAIIQAYSTLPGQHPAVAVRSSATAEDLPDASFAGQQETFLNVSGASSLLEATRKCWASLWTARAIGYRAIRNISPKEVSLAVVVQLLVPAQAAGIMFTADPVRGARNQMVINATWGLGEAVVGGLVTPDTLKVDKVNMVVVERETAVKQVMTVRSDQGTEEQPVPEALRSTPVLSNGQAAELARLGLQIEELYGMPMDIEWAFMDGKFFILQARAITVLPELKVSSPETFPTQVEWILPDPKGQYMRSSLVDVLPEPVSPLFETLGIPTLIAGVNILGRELTRTEPALPQDYYTTLNHYAYMNSHIPLRAWWWILTGLLPSFPRLMTKGHLFLKDQARPRYADTIADWEARPLDRVPIEELWEGISQVLQVAMNYLGTMLFATMGSSAGSEILFTVVYTKLVQKRDDPSAVAFLMGYDSVPIRAEKSLYDIADWCHGRESLSAYILNRPSGEIVSQLESDLPPDGVEHEEWQAFRNKFRTHLQNFGYFIYTLDFAYPLPLEHPEPMLETCKMYLRGEGVNPHQRQHASEEKREQAVRATLGRVRGLRRWAFQKTLGWAQTMSEIRETALADIGLGYPLLRKMFNEMGNRLAQKGVIVHAEGIYWLEKAEIEASMKALESGETITDMSEQIQKRKLERESLKSVTPPPILPPKEKVWGIKTDIFIAASESDQTGERLKGVAASGGKITASACVIQGSQDFNKMKPGAVLVAGVTTPAWTPLFAMASAVVTDIGGPLSHGSIVAREYGIPAVMGTGVATKRIRDGQVVTVDGDSGVVLINVEN